MNSVDSIIQVASQKFKEKEKNLIFEEEKSKIEISKNIPKREKKINEKTLEIIKIEEKLRKGHKPGEPTK